MPRAGIHTWFRPRKPDALVELGVEAFCFDTVVGFGSGTGAAGRVVHPAGIAATSGRLVTDESSRASARRSAASADGPIAVGAIDELVSSSEARWTPNATAGALAA